jgi:2-octaprenyl-6-methoxyphenol hydroxylase
MSQGGAVTQKVDVMIAGAGPSGLLLATALKKLAGKALEVLVVDGAALGAAGSSTPGPRTSAIAPAPRNMLETLGVWQRIADKAQPVLRMEISDSRLDDAVRLPQLHFDARGSGHGELAHIVFHRDLDAAVLERARELGVHIKPSNAVDFSSGVSVVSVTCADGAEVAARLLVSADGSKSLLRQRAGIKSLAWDYERVAIAATIGHERDHEGVAVQHFLEAGPFALLPLTTSANRRRSSIIWTEHPASAKKVLELSDGEFLAEVLLRAGHRLGDLQLIDRPVGFPLSFMMARTFIAPRFALVGDAAHRMHPLAGQGLNLALRDVACLADAIFDQAALGLDIGAPEVLRSYEQMRRFDSVVSAASVDLLHHIYSRDSAVAAQVRRSGMSLVDHLPLLKRVLRAEAMGVTGVTPRLFKPPQVVM